LLFAATFRFFLLKGSENIIDVIEHGDFNFTTNCVIQGHTKTLVYLASAHSCRAGPVLEDTVVLLSEVLNHAIHDLRLEMDKLTVVDMEEKMPSVSLQFSCWPRMDRMG
jgi:hypothetical protein